MATTVLHSNYHRVLARIAEHCRAAGRAQPRLLVASKGRSAAEVAALHALGQSEFGENLVSELEHKAQELQELALDWVYIGVLQSNKIARIVSLCVEIQSLASYKHARYVDRYAAQCGKTRYPVYLAVNIGAEAQKQGFAADAVEAAAAEIARNCVHLQLEGIMAVPPRIYCDRDWQQLPPAYLELRRLASRCGNGKLSLGMSSDLALALQAGSNCIRIGRALFDAPLEEGG